MLPSAPEHVRCTHTRGGHEVEQPGREETASKPHRDRRRCASATTPTLREIAHEVVFRRSVSCRDKLKN